MHSFGSHWLNELSTGPCNNPLSGSMIIWNHNAISGDNGPRWVNNLPENSNRRIYNQCDQYDLNALFFFFIRFMYVCILSRVFPIRRENLMTELNMTTVTEAATFHHHHNHYCRHWCRQRYHHPIFLGYNEKSMSSFWRNFRHWLHRKLS